MRATPLVICGPIVRRVDDDRAAVFVAVAAPCHIALEVYADDGGRPGATLMRGEVQTRAIGPGLHLAVVQARADSPVEWGTACLYDLRFTEAGAETVGLADEGVITLDPFAQPVDRLVYGQRALPGFCLPPAEPTAVRLLHGSCRKPHGEGDDTLTCADHVIGLAHQQGRRPPQQLILTGDQIYADDVHREVLERAIALEKALLGGCAEADAIEDRLGWDTLAPGERKPTVSAAGLTSGPSSNHLVTFGEFVGMYLLAWSPVAWAMSGEAVDPALRGFVDALPRVRRALANVSTYMLFDDHEITDDWNIRQSWVDAVAGSWLGRRLVRNGLAAYALFQHWGNDPDAFEDKDGAALLEGIAARPAAGLPEDLPVLDDIRPRGRLDWHWSWRWQNPAYELVGLDTRTRRDFSGGEGFALMAVADIDRALRVHGQAPPFSVVVSAAPVLGVKLIERAQQVAAEHFSDEGVIDFDFEPWFGSDTVDHLLNRLLLRSPAVVLSGDVHYGFVATAVATSGKLHEGKRIINCTSSALRNESPGLVRWGWGLGGTRPHAAGLGEPPPPNTTRTVTVGDDTVLDEEVLGGPYDTPGQPIAMEPHLSTSHKRSPVMARSNLAELDFSKRGHLLQKLWHYDDGLRVRVDEATFVPRS